MTTSNVDGEDRLPYDQIAMAHRIHVSLAIFILCFARTSLAQVMTSCTEAVLPAAVQQVLKSKFPKWRPKNLLDLEAEDRQLWLKAHPKECPGIAVGHFEAADGLSYAILLVPDSAKEASYKVVVVSRITTADAYTLKLLDHAEGHTYSTSGQVISRVPPGVYSDFEQTKSIRLRHDALNVEWIEKGSVVYYSSGGKFRKLQTSD